MQHAAVGALAGLDKKPPMCGTRTDCTYTVRSKASTDVTVNDASGIHPKLSVTRHRACGDANRTMLGVTAHESTKATPSLAPRFAEIIHRPTPLRFM
jgi:hypothetical protein